MKRDITNKIILMEIHFLYLKAFQHKALFLSKHMKIFSQLRKSWQMVLFGLWGCCFHIIRWDLLKECHTWKSQSTKIGHFSTKTWTNNPCLDIAYWVITPLQSFSLWPETTRCISNVCWGLWCRKILFTLDEAGDQCSWMPWIHYPAGRGWAPPISALTETGWLLYVENIKF